MRSHHVELEVLAVLAVVVQHISSLLIAVLLDEKGCDLVEERLNLRAPVDRRREKQIVGRLLSEWIPEGIALSEETEETVDVLQIVSPDIFWLIVHFGSYLFEGSLTLLQHITQIMGEMVQ